MDDFGTRHHDDATDSSAYVVRHEHDDETPASIAVVRAICALEDIDPAEMTTEDGFVLHDHVHPNALDTLLSDGTGDGDIVVSYYVSVENTYSIDIDDDGRISVRQHL